MINTGQEFELRSSQSASERCEMSVKTGSFLSVNVWPNRTPHNHPTTVVGFVVGSLWGCHPKTHPKTRALNRAPWLWGVGSPFGVWHSTPLRAMARNPKTEFSLRG